MIRSRDVGVRALRRAVVAGAIWLPCLMAAPRAAHAFKAPLCSNVTCSGPGGAPTVTVFPNGGLSHAEIAPIFWGSSWNTSTSPSRGAMLGTVLAAVNGAYFAATAQYGAGPPRVVPMAPTYTATTPAGHCNNGAACNGLNCADGSICGANDIQTVINASIANGTVPPPSASADMMYLVFVPPGFTSFDFNGGGVYNGISYHLAWTNGSIPGLTHEMVESIAGNVGVSGCGKFNNQIADLCQCYTATELGGQYGAYWSLADGQCVVPEGWQNVWKYNGTPNSWTQIRNTPVRQIYNGDLLIATDLNDNLVRYQGAPFSWTTIGGPGSMFAVSTTGAGILLALTPAADAVYSYSSIANIWTRVGGPATGVYAGGRYMATGYDGTPFAWTPSSNTWAQLGGPADQFAVGGDIVALATDHGSVWRNTTGTTSGWSQIGGSADELFVGQGTSIAATALAASKDVYYEVGPNNWTRQTGPATMVALTFNGSLFRLDTARTTVSQSSNTGANNPAWTAIGGSANRIIGHGTTLYAVSGIAY